MFLSLQAPRWWIKCQTTAPVAFWLWHSVICMILHCVVFLNDVGKCDIIIWPWRVWLWKILLHNFKVSLSPVRIPTAEIPKCSLFSSTSHWKQVSFPTDRIPITTSPLVNSTVHVNPMQYEPVGDHCGWNYSVNMEYPSTSKSDDPVSMPSHQLYACLNSSQKSVSTLVQPKGSFVMHTHTNACFSL